MFNPFKNVKSEHLEPKLDVPETKDNNEEIHYKEEVITNQNSSFEGVKISDWQEAGLNTISLLKVASKSMENKTRFNVPLLETTYLPFIVEQMGGILKKPNVYVILEQEISIKPEDSKWYNVTKQQGSRNAISLVKHLIAIKENLNEFEEKNILFISACKKLTELQEIANKHDEEAYKTESQSTKEGSFIPSKEKHDDLQQNSNINISKAVKTGVNTPLPNRPKMDWKARDEALNSIPMSAVLEELGAHNNEDGQAGKWKVYDTAENVGLTGDFKWYSWNGQTGGTGAISYMKHHIAKLKDLNLNNKEDNTLAYRAAVNELLEKFGSELGTFEYSGEAVKFDKPFSMPYVLDFKINQVRSYLHDVRGLPLWVINKQIQAGLLFAGYPSDWPHTPKTLFIPEKCKDEDVFATFLSINGEAAEMRGIKRTDFAKIQAGGGKKELGGFLLKSEKTYAERTVVALEAAIDACSYHAFYPGRVATSCMGVNFNLAAKAALEVIERNDSIKDSYDHPENHYYKFQLAFDNDLAGNEATVHFQKRMIEELGEEEYKKLKDSEIINYFDLGIRCFKETIEKNDIYYFDVLNNPIGRESAIMFQEFLAKDIGMPAIKDFIKEGKLKYANLWPNFGAMTNPEKEAETVYNLLCSDKPFYLKLKETMSDEEEKKPELVYKRDLFLKSFNKISESRIEQWKAEGKIIDEKHFIAKDWNEYLLYQKKKPEFRNYLENQEAEFSDKYATNKTNVEVKTKKNKLGK